MAVGSKCGTTDYRTPEEVKIPRAKTQRTPSLEEKFGGHVYDCSIHSYQRKHSRKGAKGAKFRYDILTADSRRLSQTEEQQSAWRKAAKHAKFRKKGTGYFPISVQ